LFLTLGTHERSESAAISAQSNAREYDIVKLTSAEAVVQVFGCPSWQTYRRNFAPSSMALTDGGTLLV
jgi:hypothetical protein